MQHWQSRPPWRRVVFAASAIALTMICAARAADDTDIAAQLAKFRATSMLYDASALSTRHKKLVAKLVAGLAQLACFTIAGLAVAALCTRFVLPRLMNEPRIDHADSQRLGRVADAVLRLPHFHWLALGLAAAALAVTVWARGPSGRTP